MQNSSLYRSLFAIAAILAWFSQGCSAFPGAESPERLDHLVAAGREALEEFRGDRDLEEMPPILITWRCDSGFMAQCRNAGGKLLVEVHACRIARFTDDPDEQVSLLKTALLHELGHVARGRCSDEDHQ